MKKHRAFHHCTWVIAALILLTATACSGPIAGIDYTYDYWETASNHSSSQADYMPLNYSPESDGNDNTGITASNDTADDWFRLTTPQSGQLSVTLTCTDLDFSQEIYIALYDSALRKLDDKTLSGNPGGSVAVETNENATAGDFYVRVYANSWSHRFNLTPSFSGGDTSSGYWENESNDSSSQADVMPLSYVPDYDGFDFTGIISAENTSDDWYRLTTTQSGLLAVAVTCEDLGFGEEIFIRLYDSMLHELSFRSLSGAPGGSATVYSSTNTPAGPYYVRIDSNSGTHRYDLAPSFSGSGSFAEYWENENNDSKSEADVMPLSYVPDYDGFDFTGVISAENTSDDWYQLTTTQTGRLSLTLTCTDLAFGEEIFITLYNSALSEFSVRTLAGTPGGSVTVNTSDNASAGTYYFRISADSWTHSYDLTPAFIQY